MKMCAFEHPAVTWRAVFLAGISVPRPMLLHGFRSAAKATDSESTSFPACDWQPRGPCPLLSGFYM